MRTAFMEDFFPSAAIHHMNEAIPALSVVESRRAQDYTVEKGGFGVCVYIFTTISIKVT